MVPASAHALPPPASLRERQRRARCERILNAAEALVREGRSTDFSMVALAERAEMSQTTPYNLFGSKAGILYALLSRSMNASSARQVQAQDAAPIERILRAAEVAGEVLARDPDFYRPLWRFLLGSRDLVHRPALLDRALEWWKVSMESAEAAGLFSELIDVDELARELVIRTLGVLDQWVQRELTEPELQARLAFGTGLMLLPVADDGSRPVIRAHMAVAKDLLDKSRRARVIDESERRGASRTA